MGWPEPRDAPVLWFDSNLVVQVARSRTGGDQPNDRLRREIDAADHLFRLADDGRVVIWVPDAVRRQLADGDLSTEQLRAREAVLGSVRVSSRTIFPIKFPAKFLTVEEKATHADLSRLAGELFLHPTTPIC